MFFSNTKSLLFTGLVGVILVLSATSNLVADVSDGTTQAQIINIVYVEPKYNLYVEYSVDGVNFNGMITVLNTTSKVGDKIDIDYQKINPLQISLHTNKTKMALYSSAGGIVFLILAYFAFLGLKREVQVAERVFE